MLHFPTEILHFSMKVLAGARPVFAPHSTAFVRTPPAFSQHLSPPPSSFFANLLSSRGFSFVSPFFLIHNQKSTSMAACIHTSKASQLSYDPNASQTDGTSCHMLKFHRPNFPDSSSCIPICQNISRSLSTSGLMEEINRDEEDVDLWLEIQEEARSDVLREPILSNYYCNSIFSYKSLESALANHLAMKLGNSSLPSNTLYDLFLDEFSKDKEILKAAKYDLRAVKERDPACISFVHSLLNFKGFLACQAHRVAHKLWSQGRKVLALLIQNRVSEVFAVDIHPGAKIGWGILLDHATGVVVGETAVIGNNVSILHNVTLGGTGKASGDRHPKIGDGVLIGAGTCILGNIRIGEGAKIGAGSVVLKEIPPRTTAVGNPARLVGGKENPLKLDKIPSLTMDHTSHITEWSDYVI